METIKLNYESLLKMITSKDTENRTVALEAMKNAKVTENFVCISLLLKFGKLTKEEVTNLSDVFNSFELGINNITFGRIYDKMKELNVPYDQVELYKKEFNTFIKNELNDYGYDFISDIKINLRGFEWITN